jgi:hypothetical protein
VKGDFERYLAAKATVDERALNREVCSRFRTDVCRRPEPRILEAGAGTAAFCRRFLSWDDRPDCTYVAVDTDAGLLSTARDRILDTARDEGFTASLVDPSLSLDSLSLDLSEATIVAALRLSGPARIDVHLVAGDALAVASVSDWDALVAQAFVDLLTPDEVKRLVSGVAAGGSVYFPITFDGGTAFSPPHPADEALLDAYHATMVGDNGDRLGARAGRRLRTLLPEFGVDLAAVGDADWTVEPADASVKAGAGTAYPADESYFLGVVVDTVADAVSGRVPDETVDAWLATRQRQRAAGELRFVARNLDLYGRRE